MAGTVETGQRPRGPLGKTPGSIGKVVGSIGAQGRFTPGSIRLGLDKAPPGPPTDAIYLIARMAHEMNRAYCEAMGDVSQPAWEDAPDWQKSSAIAGVQFHLANPDATPEQSHENWLKQKQEDGWVHGKVKDPEKKTHPCILPYSWLPQDQRAKDYLFRTTVHEAARLLREAEDR